MGLICITLSLLLILQLSRHCCAVADDLSSDINQKEFQVRQIANEVVRLNARKCELVAQCSSSCSRHICSPIGELDNPAMYNRRCRLTQKNPYCKASSDDSVECNEHTVNYAMSYIRLPPNMSTSGILRPEICSSICMTKHLEKIFYNISDVSKVKDELFFFGSIDGTHRSYPGEEESLNMCFNFDPRKRPWYNGAISVKKYLAVLIDYTSFSVSYSVDTPDLQTALEASKKIVQELIYTVSSDDILDVIAFNETDAYEVVQSPVIVGGELGTNINMVHDHVNMIQATKGNPTQFTNGFLDGIKLALQPDKNERYLRVILLFTNGLFASFLQNEDIEKVSTMLQNGSAKLLIYSFKDSSKLETLANKTGGFYEYTHKNFENPLYQIRSYFNFMANARKSSSDTPYWTDYYETFEEFGSIITVSYQAVSSEGQLIGVAAIDITSPTVSEDLINVLHDKLNIRPQNLNASLDPSIIRANTDKSCSSCDGSKVICPKNSSLTFAELICCGKCYPKSHDHKTWKTKIIWLVSALLVVLLLLIVALVSYRCKRRKQKNYAMRSMAFTSNGAGIYG